MTINASAPAVACKEIRINASPEEVWRVHTNIDAWSDWNADVSSARLRGSLATGSVFEWKSNGVGLRSTIEVLEPVSTIGWTGKGLGSRARHIWTLVPDGDGTILKTEESLEGWIVRLLKASVQRTLDSTLDAWLLDLKNEVEMGSASG